MSSRVAFWNGARHGEELTPSELEFRQDAFGEHLVLPRITANAAELHAVKWQPGHL